MMRCQNFRVEYWLKTKLAWWMMTEQVGGGPVVAKPLPPASPSAGGQAEQGPAQPHIRWQGPEDEEGTPAKAPAERATSQSSAGRCASVWPLCHRQTRLSRPLAPRADESGWVDPEVPDVALTRAEANTQCSVHSPEGKGGSHGPAPTPGQTRSPQAVCFGWPLPWVRGSSEIRLLLRQSGISMPTSPWGRAGTHPSRGESVGTAGHTCEV